MMTPAGPSGYQQMQRSTLSGRALEREVFARVTARLEDSDPQSPGGPAARAYALEENRVLWCTLASDLAHPGNTCPKDLRAAIISLAGFVERHTAAVRRGEAELDTLVEINRNMMAGLSPALREAA